MIWANSCLDLIGLFSVSQKTREVGIRRVLGASTSVILCVFSKDEGKHPTRIVARGSIYFLKVLLVSIA
jgi:hypothetical protein